MLRISFEGQSCTQLHSCARDRQGRARPSLLLSRMPRIVAYIPIAMHRQPKSPACSSMLCSAGSKAQALKRAIRDWVGRSYMRHNLHAMLAARQALLAPRAARPPPFAVHRPTGRLTMVAVSAQAKNSQPAEQSLSVVSAPRAHSAAGAGACWRRSCTVAHLQIADITSYLS